MRKLLLSSAIFAASTAALCAETEYRVCGQDGEAMLFGFTADGDEIIINVVGLEEQGGIVRRSKWSALMIDLGFQIVVFGDDSVTTVSKSGAAETAPCFDFERGQLEALKEALTKSILASRPNEADLLAQIAAKDTELKQQRNEIKSLKRKLHSLLTEKNILEAELSGNETRCEAAEDRITELANDLFNARASCGTGSSSD